MMTKGDCHDVQSLMAFLEGLICPERVLQLSLLINKQPDPLNILLMPIE